MLKRSANIVVRPLTEMDGPALAGLTFSVDDAGLIRYTANYQVDAIRAVQAIGGHAEGMVATLGDSGRLIGLELVRYGRCWYEGQERPYAMLGNLIVHPNYRRQGIGTRICNTLLETANARLDAMSQAEYGGAPGVAFTNYQERNPAVQRILARIPSATVGPVLYRPLTVLTKAPRPLEGISAGPIEDEELAQFAAGHNAFYQDYNLALMETPERLKALLERDILPASGTRPEGRIRHAYAAFDRSGQQVAGLVAFEQYRVRQLEIRGLPGVLQLMNLVSPVVPQDGMMREIYLDHVWFAPGAHDAATHLIDTVRWIWHGTANNVSIYLDPRSPVGRLFSLKPWDIAAHTRVAVQLRAGLPAPDQRRLISPIY